MRIGMRRKVTALCFVMMATWLTMTTTEAVAQTRIPREVSVGVIGGANLSDYDFHPSVDTQLSKGYTMGVAVRYIEETYFGLQTELLLTQRGFADYYEDFQELNFERKLTYVELPVMAHIYFKMGQKNEIAVDMGPKFGWFLTDSSKDNLPPDFGQPDTPSEAYSTLHHTLPLGERKFDYGIQAGLGYEFKFSPLMSMQLQGRYYYGLANIWPDTKADNFQQSSNQSIQVVVSFWWKHVIRGKKVFDVN